MKAKCKALGTVLISSVYANSPGNRIRLTKLLRNKKSDLILFVISPGDINSPSYLGRYPDKVYSLYEIAINLGYRSEIVFHPWVARDKVSNTVPIIRVESIFRNLFTALKLHFRPEEFSKTDKMCEWWKSSGALEKIQYCVWRNFLDRTNPKVVFGIGIREDEVLACNARSIPIYEVMHGTFTENDLPLRRFSRGETRTVEVDMFLTWDSHYSKVFETLRVPTKVIGHPNKSYLGVKTSTSKTLEKKVLVTLSWGVEKSIDPYGILESDLAMVLSQLVSRSFSLIFRLHPVTAEKHKKSKDSIRAWFQLNFPDSIVSFPENTSLLEDLLSVDLHVTHESSAFYEAGLLGVPTIFTSRRGFEAIPRDYRDSGNIHFWENKQNLGLSTFKMSSGKKFGNDLDFEVVTELITHQGSLRNP